MPFPAASSPSGDPASHSSSLLTEASLKPPGTASWPLASAWPPAGLFLARRVIDFCLLFEGLLCALKYTAKCSPSKKKKKDHVSSSCVRSLAEQGDPGGELAQGFIYVNCPPLFLASLITKLPCGAPVKHLMCSIYRGKGACLPFPGS